MAHMRTNRFAAFTLVELLVVMGIIAVLAGLALVVGTGVIKSQRAATTQNTIQMLETYLSDLDATGEDKRSYKAFKTEFEGRLYELPVLDGRPRGNDNFNKVADRPIDSLARFLSAGDQFLGDSSDRWGGLDSSLVQDVELADTGTVTLRGVALTDQWGQPIRAVHPSYDGGFGNYQNAAGQVVSTRAALSVDEVVGGTVGGPTSSSFMFRRSYRPFAGDSDPESVGDADEGICQNERVYFYSAGPDGDPGAREDNVYGSVTPQYPNETRGLD